MFPIRDHNPSSGTPFVVYVLILLNVAIHIWQAATVRTNLDLYGLYDAYAMIPYEVSQGQDLSTLVTSQFLHGGWMHLLGNMLFLWIFGDNLEEALGHAGFLLFYLLGGVGAALCQWASAPLSDVATIGASGAIAAVMGGYLVLYPKARVDVLLFVIIIIRIIPVPAWIMLALWLVFQLFGGFAADPLGGGVAYWAHVGGFAVGLVLIVPAWLRRGGAGWWAKTDGTPPHPDASYGNLTPSRVPTVRRRR
jgi:membrane associated rhomboid family serine protease